MTDRLHVLLVLLFAAAAQPAVATDAGPESPGTLLARHADGSIDELPLLHTDVRVEISAFVARTVIEQTFANPLDVPIEAIYAFPLGDEAAVDDFELRSGSRVIRGEIRRRAEARRIYETARRDGRQAALLEQERPNVFIQSVANLMPGDDVRVRLRTVEVLEYHGGTYEYLFPTVVGPRYDPSPALQASSARERPGQRSGHDIAIRVELDAGVPIDSIVSPTQTIYVSHRSPSAAGIELSAADRIPNKDFILRWNVASARPEVGLLSHRDGGDGFFALLVQPLGRVEIDQAAPKEVVFVLDTSGSMRGTPLEMSKSFVVQALRSLGPRDRFNLIRFGSESSLFSPYSRPNDPGAVRDALRWVGGLNGHGGTEMLQGLRRATVAAAEDGAFRQIVFLTDGFIGDDEPILAAISELPDGFRVFTIGIGTSVNHHLLDRMARRGDGAYTYIPDDADRVDALERFRSWVTRPYLTDLRIDWGALPVADIVPDRPRDLFSGQNLYVLGRYHAAARGTVTLRGYLAGRYWEHELDVDLPEGSTNHAALAPVWARHRIEELVSDEADLEPDEVRERVTELALRHRLMSAYTSFVAVDRSGVVNTDGTCRRVVQPAAAADDDLEITERVRITATSALIDLSSNAHTSTFSDEFVQDLPVPGRFYQNVLLLAQGGAARQQDLSPVVRASHSRDMKTFVDGVAALAPLGGQGWSAINPNSIEELELITAGAGVEFSRAQGGFARVVQKQGSNDFEGELEASVGAQRTASSSVAAIVSGPIVKDRLWYRASHGFGARRESIDTIGSLVDARLRSSRHEDRLTWQASPRNKLAFAFRGSTHDGARLDVDSWRGPRSATASRASAEAWSLGWTVPVSPRLLVETTLSRQRLEDGIEPAAAGSPNGCLGGAHPYGDAYCTDWIDGRIGGRWFLDTADRRTGDTLRVTAAAYPGRHFGVRHELRAGFELTHDAYGRSSDRRPELVRLDDGGGARVLARLAAEPPVAAAAAARGAALWVEDRLAPTTRVVITLGLRLDALRLDARRTASASSAQTDPPRFRDERLSPFVELAWDPRGDGAAKLFATLRRYHGDLHPAVPLLELGQSTVDLDLGDGSGPLPPLTEVPRNVTMVDRRLRAPHHDEWTLGYERRIAVETRLTVTAVERRFSDRLGFVDLNHAEAAGPGPWVTLDPTRGEVVLIGNRHSATGRSLILEIVRRQYRSWELQGSYTWSSTRGDGPWLSLGPGDVPSRRQVLPGADATDRRHRLVVFGVWLSPWGVRFGGVVRWESGLPYTAYESGALVPTSADGTWRGVPVPRLFVVDAERNRRRNESAWTLDVRLSRELNVGRGVSLSLAAEAFNLLDDRGLLVWDALAERGETIDGSPQRTRRFGRWYQVGATVRF